tara:strand:+ start:859 stop:1149 length:291 start_codon:yes stop_codon:yes gene_type:complete
MAVVETDALDLLRYLWVVLQHHYVTGHQCLVEPVRYLHRLFRCVLVRLRYQDQHVLLVEVELPDVCEYCAELAYAIQLQELDLAIHDGLLSKRAWW